MPELTGQFHDERRAREEVESLLALIHGDGGHHTTEVGLEQSLRDAEALWDALVERAADLETENERLRADRQALAEHRLWIRLK